jgi:hypothetical protein
MVLTLAAQPVLKNRQRSVIPACLQARAPLSYEIQDEGGKRIAPTLAGYKLRRGKTYHLLVRTQDKNARGWKLRLPAPRSTVEMAGPDEIKGDARVITFHTVEPGVGEPWKKLRSDVTSLPVALDFEDGREPYRFTIPVVLLASRFRWIGSLLLTALASFAANAIFRERLALPSLPQVLLVLGIWILVVLACVSWDQWKLYRQALRLLTEGGRAGETGQRATSMSGPDALSDGPGPAPKSP